ncbi:MAG: HTH domain-containing protein, partial [Acidimicrobiia bacterium]
MADTTARVLRLLTLLQAHRSWSGQQLIDRLEISERT